MVFLAVANGVFSQPLITVWGSTNPNRIRDRAEHFLKHLDVGEQLQLAISVYTGPPGLLKGMTIPLYGSDSSLCRRFKVIIDGNVSRRKQMIVLAHEMIHVRQYVRNELVRFKDADVIWDGRVYNYFYTISHKPPWERVAYRLDHHLAKLVDAMHDGDATACNDRAADNTNRRLARQVSTWDRVASDRLR
jgi:hypothetical protein